jgi:hypothetical protein
MLQSDFADDYSDTENDPPNITRRDVENVYRFALSFIDSENEGQCSNTKALTELAQLIEFTLQPKNINVQAARTAIKILIESRCPSNPKAVASIQNLVRNLDIVIQAPADLAIFGFMLKQILIPMSILLEPMPFLSDDKEVKEALVGAYLEHHRDTGLADVIGIWDKVTQLQRTEVEHILARKSSVLRKLLEELTTYNELQGLDIHEALTAFVQEFERRLLRGVRRAHTGRTL